jgi:hypothetical protein
MAKKHIGQVQYDHPSQDRSNRFAIDVLIRSEGYRIHSRRDKEEPIWERNGKRYMQREVLEWLDQNKLLDAEYMESLYWEDWESLFISEGF